MECKLQTTSKNLLQKLIVCQNETKKALGSITNLQENNQTRDVGPGGDIPVRMNGKVSSKKNQMRPQMGKPPVSTTSSLQFSSKKTASVPSHAHRDKRRSRPSTPPHLKRQRQQPSRPPQSPPCDVTLSRETSPCPRDRSLLTASCDVDQLLEDTGNLRPLSSAREERVSEDDGEEVGEPRSLRGERMRSILTRSAVLRRTPPSRVQFTATSSGHTRNLPDPAQTWVERAPVARDDAPVARGDLLGYDWIAGMLENRGADELLDRPADYFEDLGRFRTRNRDDCFAKEFQQEAYAAADRLTSNRADSVPRRIPISQLEEVRELEQPVYAYALNDRLFPVPVDPNTANRPHASEDEPQIIKVSIPSARLRKEPSRLCPHRRRSFDENADTASLVHHCQRGFCPPVPQSRARRADPADLRTETGQGGGNREQPKTQAEAVAQLKRGSQGARRIRVGPSGELPAPDDLLLEESGGRGTVGAMLARRQLADQWRQPGLRTRPQAARSRMTEAYRTASARV